MTTGAYADILLVTATKVETAAVIEVFDVAGQQAKPRSIDGRIYFDFGKVNGTRVMMTQSEMGAGGLGASQHSVGKGIAALAPAAVIMVGIAFGVSEVRQRIGDVLVAERLRLYDLQRMGTQDDGTVKIVLRDDKPHVSPSLLNLFKSAEITWKGAELRFGTVLTGAKLIDNLDFREHLRSFEPEAIGGEMEGAGLYVACHDQKVDWILIKAICDFADGQKAKDRAERQAVAAKNAATFLHHALFFAKVDWSKAMCHTVSNSTSRGQSVGECVKFDRSPIAISSHLEGAAVLRAASVDYDKLYTSVEPHLQEITEKANVAEVPAFLLYADIDGFTALNKKFGSVVCDAVALQVEVLIREVAESKFAARFGADQFIVVAGAVDKCAFVGIAESVVRQIDQYAWDSIMPNLYVHVSVGFAQFRTGEAIREWLIRAITGAFFAKRTGGNRVVEAPQFLQPQTSLLLCDHCS